MEAHSCKICKRVFSNGRSLGGHIRSHVMIKSSSPEYAALCLMMLSRGACSVSDKNEIERFESDILRIGINKVGSFPSESEKRRKSSRKDFDSGFESSTKRNKYECTICNKSFHSYQALGGHCASHKKSRTDSSSVSVIVAEHLISPKFRSHECPICEKKFPSGQALGGHKRSHLILGNSTSLAAAASSTEIIGIEQKNSKLNSLDLNLPASDLEDCDSFDSNKSIGEEKFTDFQESYRLSAFMM